MPTNWIALRAWNGSQENGIRGALLPALRPVSRASRTRFIRKAPRTQAWSASGNYLTVRNTAGRQSSSYHTLQQRSGAQIDHSVKTALVETRQTGRDTRGLYAGGPIRCQAQGKRRASRAMGATLCQPWSKWEARERGMSVEFTYWGNSELVSRLSQEGNRGRYWFWFNSEVLTIEWFKNRLKSAIADAGERYTPELHVDLPISQSFDALGLGPGFYDRLNELYVELRECAGRFRGRLCN